MKWTKLIDATTALALVTGGSYLFGWLQEYTYLNSYHLSVSQFGMPTRDLVLLGSLAIIAFAMDYSWWVVGGFLLCAVLLKRWKKAARWLDNTYATKRNQVLWWGGIILFLLLLRHVKYAGGNDIKMNKASARGNLFALTLKNDEYIEGYVVRVSSEGTLAVLRKEGERKNKETTCENKEIWTMLLVKKGDVKCAKIRDTAPVPFECDPIYGVRISEDAGKLVGVCP